MIEQRADELHERFRPGGLGEERVESGGERGFPGLLIRVRRKRDRGNVAHAGFAGLIGAARECKVPVFSPSPFEVMQGATLSYFPDFQEGGVQAGRMIARVLKGEKPAAIPFYRVERTRVAVNEAEAGKLGLKLPPEVLRQADSAKGR